MKKDLHFKFKSAIIISVERQRTKVGIADVEGTPVPIPNTEVKLNSAEDTWAAAPRKNRKTPTLCRVVVQ